MPATRPAIRIAALATCLLPLQAQAHPGHLADVAGHSHWLGAAALAAAIALAALRARKGRRDRDAENAQSEAEEAMEEGEEELAEAR